MSYPLNQEDELKLLEKYGFQSKDILEGWILLEPYKITIPEYERMIQIILKHKIPKIKDFLTRLYFKKNLSPKYIAFLGKLKYRFNEERDYSSKRIKMKKRAK